MTKRKKTLFFSLWTGFQTHTTPVLLAVGDRAELATDKHISKSPVLEGVVILEKNEFSEEAME